jgi:hypothetical protein
MARLKIATIREFCAAMEAIPSLRARLEELRERIPDEFAEVQTNAYRAWFVYLQGCEDAINMQDWRTLGRLFEIYEGVERARKSEMADSSHVAFVEDLKLPTENRTLNRVLATMGPKLAAEISRDRRITFPRFRM